jgi:DNA-binding GntR family transcriptional regulator
MLRSRLKNEIADLILSGGLKPGQRLDEQSLAARFGVSRTPVREALQQLGIAGLVEIRPRRSARVRVLSMAELESSFEAMGEIEAICARYAAERMTEAERISLKLLMEESREASIAKDRVTCRDLDASFHSLLHIGAHNPALCSVADEMRVRVELYSSSPYTLPSFDTQLDVPHGQHEQIAQAVLSRDPAAAHRAMIEHIGQSFLVVKRILEGESSAPAVIGGDRPFARRGDRAADAVTVAELPATSRPTLENPGHGGA